MAFLLTWHGTLLSRRRADGVLVHRPLDNIGDDAEPLALDLPIERLQVSFSHHLRAVLPNLPEHAPGVLQRFQLRWSDDQRTINFGDGNAFLSAEIDGDRVELFRTEARSWESFIPISQADLDALRQILASSWLVRSTGTFVERPTAWQYFQLRIGQDLAVDLRYQMPFDLANWPFRLTLLRDGWRIDQICQYRPLVYFAAFGSADIMEQFAISLRSLIKFGRYQGQIAVLTDHSPSDLAELLPAEDFARLQVIRFRPHDRPGFMAARYLILDWPDAWAYQPILYVDTDIVFDRDVTPMLHAIGTSDRITAPIEVLSVLTTSPASGATLLQRDFCSPGYMAGFNSGTIGIPNLREHAEPLRLIRRLITNYCLLNGRGSLPYADQEVANYVSYRLAHFDTSRIARFVRFCGTDAYMGAPCGLVHFWPVIESAAARAQAMRDYFNHIDAAG